MISPMSPLGNCKVNKEDNNHNIDNKIIEIIIDYLKSFLLCKTINIFINITEAIGNPKI